MNALIYKYISRFRPRESSGRLIWQIIYVVLLILILKFYFWTTFQGYPVSIPDASKAGDYYSQLTDALLSGKFHFLQPPAQELLTLKDPYDPAQNGPYRLHDASLYKGKWYIYFGVTPVLLLWLPARILGFGMNEAIAAPIFIWLGLIASLGFLRNISRFANLKIERWLWIFVTLLLALCNSTPFMLRRPAIYETAISAAYCCLMIALYFFSLNCNSGRILKRYFVLGSLFIALSVGARPNYFLFGSVVLFVSFLTFRRLRSKSLKERVKEQSAIWIPYIFIGCCLAMYNYIRFDSFTEFGTKYVLAGVHMQKIKLFSMDSLYPGLYFYLWQSLSINKVFPYFHALPGYPFKLPPEYVGPEQVAGVFSLCPFLIIAFLMIAYVFTRKDRYSISKSVKVIIAGFVMLGIIQVVFLSVALPSATMRYIVDFLPLFLISSILAWFAVNTILTDKRKTLLKYSINVVVSILVIYGCLANVAIGMTGYYDGFKNSNPIGYKKVKTLFPISCTYYNLSISITDQKIVNDPIMYLGSLGNADLIYIQRDLNQYRFGIDHWGVLGTFSEWYPLNAPLNLKTNVEVCDSHIKVATKHFNLISSYAPFNPGSTPVLGKNDIGFSNVVNNSAINVKLNK